VSLTVPKSPKPPSKLDQLRALREASFDRPRVGPRIEDRAETIAVARPEAVVRSEAEPVKKKRAPRARSIARPTCVRSCVNAERRGRHDRNLTPIIIKAGLFYAGLLAIAHWSGNPPDDGVVSRRGMAGGGGAEEDMSRSENPHRGSGEENTPRGNWEAAPPDPCVPKDLVFDTTGEPGPLDSLSPEQLQELLGTIRAFRAKQIDGEAG
jgi:hypothetical protein